MIRKVWAYGCSVTACAHPNCQKRDETYPAFLAKMLGAEYENHAIGCGSNYRIFRLVNSHILQGKIKSNDLVTIQYTAPERKEFFSKYILPNVPYRGEHQNGQTINYKLGVYAHFEEERELLKKYENVCVDTAYEIEIARGRHAGLLSLAELKGINIIFVEAYPSTIFDPDAFKVIDNVGVSNFKTVDVRDVYEVEEYQQLASDGSRDRYHFSPKGHQAVAEKIYNSYI